MKQNRTLAEKIEIVRLLREHHGDYKLVGKLTGAKYASMRNWVRLYSKDLDDTKVLAIAKETEYKIGDIKAKFINKNYQQVNELFNSAAAKAKGIIENNAAGLEDINQTMKILLDYIVKMQGNDEVPQQNTTNIIQASIQTLNQIKG